MSKTFWTIDNIARIATGGGPANAPRKQASDAVGAAASTPPDASRSSPSAFGFTLDSRSVTPGQVFVAFKGERTDGHRHVADAARAGASAAIVSDGSSITPEAPPGFPVIEVGDVTAALARLAAAYRDTLVRTLVVGVTGSAGKTTTTRLIAAALAELGPGTHPAKSFNNAIGVPITVLNARPDDAFLVCEIGTSAPGEIESLARIVRPDVGVITSIGRAHVEFLGSVEGVAREKAALLRHASALALAPTPCPALAACTSDLSGLRFFGRGPGAHTRLGRVEMMPEVLRFEVEGSGWFSIPMLGEHNAMNALAAVSVARHAGLTDDQIRRGLATARGASMRLERSRIAGIDIINDAYNANPESMRAAIDTLAAIRVPPGGRRVLILGDMLELGQASSSAHAEVMRHVATHGAAFPLICALGQEMAKAAGTTIRPGLVCEPVLDDAAADRVAARLRPGDAVLLKGSRGMRVERIADALRRMAGAECHSCSA